MFDKFKQLQKARELQNALSQERAEVEKQGIKVIVTGTMKIDSITLNPGLDQTTQEQLLKECINEAMQKIQMIAAQKMSEMGGMF
ncbi:MAG: YbaB/EbfC family nucleoid-associated protein [Candidatus Pacebacteria bacterium]|nr:YbaB/EbfC family nucleoid-associated protein [Candidatus Paceibacterota bacterium]